MKVSSTGGVPPSPLEPSVSSVAPSAPVEASDRVHIADPLHTDWGFGGPENQYNQLILDAIDAKWTGPPPLPPIILKSTVAQESAFDPKAKSPSGYVGLLQVGPEEAKNQGLKLEPIDERTIPEKNLPCGVAVLGVKHGVVRNPLGLWDTPFAHAVQDYYDKNGLPSDRQIWYLSLAAYNGGGGTVLKAMAAAIERNLDPREWSNLIGAPDNPKASPLYKAITDTYSSGVWMSKFKEMSRYPVSIMNRAGVA